MTPASLTYLGTGWSFPVGPLPRRPDTRAVTGLLFAAGVEKVRQSILLILETEPGERVMRPTFGAGLRRFLMKPNTDAIRAQIQIEVERALRAFEPRIQLRAVSVRPGEDPALVLVEIDYLHVRDGRPGNLVYPFSLE
jgi:uncharacterized protein